MSLAFSEQTLDHQQVFIGGIYKIVPRHVREFGGVVFYAYFKPKGWDNWGMRVDRGIECYPTLDDARAACRRHHGKS
jgi:hypothetical protein